MKRFSAKQNVDFHDVDFNGICKASTLLRYMQSSAQRQLNDAKLGYDELKKQNRAFIVSRITLEFDGVVHEDDTLTATTYPCESTGFSFIRYFELSKNEKRIARAISLWALIDTEKRNLVKVSDFDLPLKTYPAPDDFTIPRIKFPSDLKLIGTYKVGYGDLDKNRHINNTRYPDIFSSFLALENKRIFYRALY